MSNEESKTTVTASTPAQPALPTLPTMTEDGVPPKTEAVADVVAPIVVTDVMLDLETLGVDRGSIVLSATAFRFDRNQEILRIVPGHGIMYNSAVVNMKDPRYVKRVVFSLTRQMQAGLKADQSTLDWYYRQGSGSKYKEIQESGACVVSLFDSISELHGFFLGTQIMGGRDTCIWANSPNFDVEIIRFIYGLFKHTGLEFPFDFRHWMDSRTTRELYKMIFGKYPEAGDRSMMHDPVFDCIYQINTLRLFLCQILKIKQDEVTCVSDLTKSLHDLRLKQEQLMTASKLIRKLRRIESKYNTLVSPKVKGKAKKKK